MASYLRSLDPRHAPRTSLLIASVLVILVAMILTSTPFSLPFVALNISAPFVTNTHTSVSYKGTFVNDIEHFQNIFYAKDTSGVNRFAPPVPYTPPPKTTVDATAAGAWCPQGTGGPPLPFTSPITNISEDCLSLRIARAKGTDASAKLPVLVWLHGGGDALGSASDKLYEPDGLLRQAKLNGQPVIWVGINYRLGIFGFAISKALKTLKHTNAGLRDQRTAFDWVRDNIGYFGGNPDNIIAIGQSVGAMAIGLHLTSYGGVKGVPFHKAIMMSGATGTNFNIKSSVVADNTAAAAKAVGCSDDPDSQATLDCLRSIPFETLTQASVGLARQARPPFGELFYSPSYDGDYITDRPSVLLRKGSFVKGLPLLASWVTNDGAWYAAPTTATDSEVTASFERYILNLSPNSLQRLLALYPVSDFTSMVRPNEPATPQYYRAAQINRDIWFTCPVLDFTYHYALHPSSTNNVNSSSTSPSSSVHIYEMNATKFTPIFAYMGVPEWRVAHLSDIPYVLNLDVSAGGDNSPPQRELSAQLSGSVSTFAWTGNPNVNVKSGNLDATTMVERRDAGGTSGVGQGREQGFTDWPPAYDSSPTPQRKEEGPDELDVFVIGGEWGSGKVRETMKASGEAEASDREKAARWEMIVERCRFINSITEEIGV